MSNYEGIKLNHTVIWTDEKVDRINAKEYAAHMKAQGVTLVNEQGQPATPEEVFLSFQKHRANWPTKTDWMRVYNLEELAGLFYEDCTFVLMETPQQRTTRLRALEAKTSKLVAKIEVQQSKAPTTEAVANAPTLEIYKSATKNFESNVAFVKSLEIGKVYEIPAERLEANLPAAARQNRMKVSVKMIGSVKTITRLS